jgi:uncharacterized protein YjiS (DUF1127 family)
VNTQMQAFNRCTMEASRTLYDNAETSAAASSALYSRDGVRASSSLVRIVHRFRTGFRLASARYRQRQQLTEMDDRQLKDIGTTPEQVEQVANKPIWTD